MKIESSNGWLRLSFNYQGKRYRRYLNLKDTKANRLKAEQTKLIIEADIEESKFDTSFIKYKIVTKNPEALNISCLQLAELWIEFKTKVCDARTIHWYRHILLGDLSFIKTSAPQISIKESQDFVGYLSTKQIKTKTIKRKIKILKSLWDWAINMGYVTSNPWKQIILPTIDTREQPDPFSKKEAQKIIAAFESSPIDSEFTPLIKFLFLTGCRLGEAIGLRWGDITGNQINITTQVTNGKRKKPKCGKIRSFGVSPQLLILLNNIKPTSCCASDVVFTVKDKEIDVITLRRAWMRTLKAAGVRYRRPYNCRHTFISHALESGMNPVTVAKIVGDTTQTIFEFYAGCLHDHPAVPNWME